LRSLGLDVGDKRIGLALSDPLGMLARPLSVLERTEDSVDVEKIAVLAGEQQVAMIIVGLPRSIDGTLGSQAQKVQKFAELLKTASAIPVAYRDERYTTMIAKDLIEAGGKKKKRYSKKGEDDALAAAVILQSYLNESMPLQYPVIEKE
jgi:putative Holliday junction resolvase